MKYIFLRSEFIVRILYTGALDRIYADCRLGLLVCCFVVHVQNDKNFKLTKLDRERGVGVVGG